MDIQKVNQYKSVFDSIVHEIKDDEGNAMEVWYARELQSVLGYARWENFVVAIGRAMESCKSLNVSIDDHFRELTKMIPTAKSAFSCERISSFPSFHSGSILGSAIY